MHILHLNVSSLLPNIDEIGFTAKQSNALIIGISETKLDSSTSNSEVDIIGLGRSRRGGGVACYIKKSLSYTYKSIFLSII